MRPGSPPPLPCDEISACLVAPLHVRRTVAEASSARAVTSECPRVGAAGSRPRSTVQRVSLPALARGHGNTRGAARVSRGLAAVAGVTRATERRGRAIGRARVQARSPSPAPSDAQRTGLSVGVPIERRRSDLLARACARHCRRGARVPAPLSARGHVRRARAVFATRGRGPAAVHRRPRARFDHARHPSALAPGRRRRRGEESGARASRPRVPPERR